MNSGNSNINSLNIETKLSLLMRSVYSAINWKLARWPYQKSIAEELDGVQVHMVSILQRLPRLEGEDGVSWSRRSLRLARNSCSTIGLWSEAWARRAIDWHDHIMRRPSILKDLFMCQNSDWLQARRSLFVPSHGSGSGHYSIHSGRTDTRLFPGQPPPRWESGIKLARSFLDTRSMGVRGNNALSLGNRIRQAAIRIRELFNRPP